MKIFTLAVLLLLLALPAQATTVTLKWTLALDDVTPQSNLLYELRQSTGPNLTTVDEIEANGVVILPYGANRDSAYLSNLPAGLTYFFNVVVKDEAGNRAAYKMATVTIPDVVIPVAPVITYQPVSQTVRRGWPVSFVVVANGVPPPTFQWYRSGVLLVDATGASYKIAAVRQQDNGASFTVKVVNQAGAVTSQAAVLHVKR